MSSNLATKQDLNHLNELMAARFEAVAVRFKELEDRFSLKLENMESRIVIKLGALMVVLIGLATTVQTLLR